MDEAYGGRPLASDVIGLEVQQGFTRVLLLNEGSTGTVLAEEAAGVTDCNALVEGAALCYTAGATASDLVAVSLQDLTRLWSFSLADYCEPAARRCSSAPSPR